MVILILPKIIGLGQKGALIIDTKSSTQQYRRYLAHLGPFNTNHIHQKYPWVAVWWSACFPGMGHLIHGAYLKGFVLFFWEFTINLMANVNLAIIYTFIGEFDLAIQVIDTRWFLLYPPVYVIAMWDSYRNAVEINKLYILAKRENAPITPFSLTTFGINYLDKRTPWVALFWSLIMPGVGHLYLKRLPTGFFLLIIWIVMVYFSNILPAIHYTMLGQFNAAKSALNPQWFLFMPSIYGFAFYKAYMLTVEYNRIFKKEQAEFFKKSYQHVAFTMPKI